MSRSLLFATAIIVVLWTTGPLWLTEHEKRQHRLLDALFKALEELGAKVQPMDWRKYYFEVEGERIDVQLREKQRQVRRLLTAEEKDGATMERMACGRCWNRQGGYLFALAIALLTGLYSLTPTAGNIENRYRLGLLYALRQPLKAPPGAVIIGIDRQTLDCEQLAVLIRNSARGKD
jgi:hypothetical protein